MIFRRSVDRVSPAWLARYRSDEVKGGIDQSVITQWPVLVAKNADGPTNARELRVINHERSRRQT